MYERLRKSFINLVAQRIDVNIEHIAHAVEVDVPDVLHDHRPRHGPASVPEKKLQQRVLLQPQVDGLAGAHDTSACRIHLEITDVKSSVGYRTAAQKGANTR